jgi:hypothetical protein
MANEYNKSSIQGHSGKENQPKAKITPRSTQADTMAEQYHYYYDRIYPLLKEGKLDFPRIALKTDLKERRIRETLLFRLTSGEVMQLFGRKNGFCYICGYKTHSPSNKEPVCLSCLKCLDTAIQEIHIAEIVEQQKSQNTFEVPAITDLPHLLEPQDGEFQQSPPEPVNIEMITKTEYEQAAQELERYRKIFGPLPSIESAVSLEPVAETIAVVESAESEPEVSEPTPEVMENNEVLEYESEIDPLFKMLKMDDRDVPSEVSVADLFSSAPIRHFGFHRQKGGSV